MKKGFIRKAVCTVSVATLAWGISTPAFAADPAQSNLPAVNAPAPSWAGNVQFVNQLNLTDKTYRTFDVTTTKPFANPTDQLGNATTEQGLYRSLVANFVCWSTEPQDASGSIPSTARIFRANDSIKTAFPQGLKGGEKLYAVYVSVADATRINEYFNGGNDSVNLGGPVNKENVVTIDKNVNSEDVLPNTDKVRESTGVESDEIATNRELRTIIDKYVVKNDVDTINEVVMKANFDMEKRIALLVYDNPVFGYEGKRVLTENYSTLTNWNFNKGREAGYTYVDLVVTVDKQIETPKMPYLRFSGHSWRPLYVLSPDRSEALEIFNPTTGDSLGNTKDSFKTLVNNTSENVEFKVANPKQYNTLIIRTILRDGQERIGNVVADDSSSIAEKIVSKMELVALDSKELMGKYGLSKEEAYKHVYKITDAEAKKLAETQGNKTVKIAGFIEGVARSSVGTISGLGNTESFTEIKPVPSNVLRLGYVMDEPEAPKPEEPKKEAPKPQQKPEEPKKAKPVLVKKELAKTGVAGFDATVVAIAALAGLGLVGVGLRKKQK